MITLNVENVPYITRPLYHFENVPYITRELTGAEEYGLAWDTVVEWIERNNYEVDMSRPSYKIYLNNPEEHPEKHHIVDICRSVKAK